MSNIAATDTDNIMFDAIPDGWAIVFWICFSWTVLFVPVALYYLWIYSKYRHEAFFRARMSNATIMKMVLLVLVVIHRCYDGLIGIRHEKEDPINHMFNFIELYPISTVYVYKYVICCDHCILQCIHCNVIIFI